MGSKTKQVAGVAAAPFTGGASLALSAEGKLQEKKEDKLKKQAKKASELSRESNKRQTEVETENKRLSKELDIATRQKKSSGLSSLIGGETEYFG